MTKLLQNAIICDVRMIPNFQPKLDLNPESIKNSYWFIIKENNLLVKKQKDQLFTLPEYDEVEKIKSSFIRTQSLGIHNNKNCFSAEYNNNAQIPADMEFFNVRKLWGLIDEHFFYLAGYASQIVTWDQTFQYCGRCGHKTENFTGERAKICPKCNLINYPRLSPSIIVAVVKDNKILLARSTHFKTKMFSVLAGFVEPGESLEDCAQREVKEEVNIDIKNLQYFGSQSWPFPHSLMLGFTAEYKSGEITINNNEIAEADWFSSDNLPLIPERLSIARYLIDWFVSKSVNT